MVALLDLGLPSPSAAAAPPRVLVCGDADFAYTSALRNALPSARILATAFEPEAELLARYPQLDRYICDLIVPLDKNI